MYVYIIYDRNIRKCQVIFSKCTRIPLTNVAGGFLYQDFCKTKSSKRTIAITAGLVAVLREHKEAMMKLAEDTGEEWSEESLVFRNSRGNMVYSRNLQEVLYRIYDKAEIEGATMHTLRHSYATHCFEAGVDIKAISEQLGHANGKTTYNIYVHLLEDTKAKEIDKLGEIDKFIA